MEFSELVSAESVRLQRLAWGLTGNRADAEDLVQDTLVQCYRRWTLVERADNPPAYVRQVLINLHRRRRFRPEDPVESVPEGRLLDDPDVVGQRLALLRGLATLPVQQRQVVALRFLDDQSVTSTAEVLGCSPSTVTTQTSRALARLRQLPELRSILEEDPCLT